MNSPAPHSSSSSTSSSPPSSPAFLTGSSLPKPPASMTGWLSTMLSRSSDGTGGTGCCWVCCSCAKCSAGGMPGKSWSGGAEMGVCPCCTSAVVTKGILCCCCCCWLDTPSNHTWQVHCKATSLGHWAIGLLKHLISFQNLCWHHLWSCQHLLQLGPFPGLFWIP